MLESTAADGRRAERPPVPAHRDSAHAILDLQPSATPAEVKAQYRRLAKVWHPDRFVDQEMKVFTNRKLGEINRAYDELAGRRRA